MRPRWLHIAALALFACLLYANTIGHQFAFDDEAVLVNNRFVQKGVDGISEILSTGSWDGYEPTHNIHIYRPMQLIALALQYELFALEPMGYHAVQILTYALLCVLVYCWLVSVTGQLRLSFLAALLFTAHPVHTEVVANVKGNGDLLAMLWGMLALLGVWGSIRRPYLLLPACISCLIAMLTKETVVPIVGLGGLSLLMFSELSWQGILARLTPLALMVPIYMAIRSQVFTQNAYSLVESTNKYDNALLFAETWSQAIGMRLWALGKNFQLLLYPYPLKMMYVHDDIPLTEIYDFAAPLAALIYSAMAYVAYREWRRRSVLSFAICAYLGTLFLFSNIAVSTPNILSERWLLLPSLGFCLAAAHLLQRWQAKAWVPASATLLLVVVGLSAGTRLRNPAWYDNLTISSTDVQHAPRSVIINSVLANSLLHAATQTVENTELLERSVKHSRLAAELNPSDANRYLMLAFALSSLGKHEEAVDALLKIFNWQTDYTVQAHYYIAANMKAMERYEEAVNHLLAIKQIKPETEFQESHWPPTEDILGELADCLLGLTEGEVVLDGALKRAIVVYEEYLELRPGDVVRRNNLGILYERLGEHQRAADIFRQVTDVESTLKDKARFSMATNYNRAALYSEAADAWRALLVDYPDNEGVLLGLQTAEEGLADDLL